MPSSTSSSERGVNDSFFLYIGALLAGVVLAWTITWAADRTGIWKVLDIDPSLRRKWDPPVSAEWLTFLLQPRVPTGRYFFRRQGPIVHEGRLLRTSTEKAGFGEHPYGNLPRVRVSYGKLGFRDEYPPVPGGTALLGSSYVEAGFSRAEDTYAGWLKRDHGIAAGNFGVSFVGGYTVLHYLEHFVLPTRPRNVVWIFAERSDFARIIQEKERIRTYRRPGRKLPGLGSFLLRTPLHFLRSAANGWRKYVKNWIGTFVRRRLSLRLAKTSRPPRGIAIVGGRKMPVDVTACPTAKTVQRARQFLAEALEKMKRKCDKQGIHFVVVYLPSRKRLLDGFWETPPKGKLCEGQGFFGALERICGRFGISVSDATIPLRQALGQGRLVINPVFDQHLNSRGMRIVAGVIAKHIKPPVP